MGLYNNVPTFTYISASGITVSYNNKVYTVQSFYTNKKYIYWDSDNGTVLQASNTMPTRSAKTHLVLINDNGIATTVPSAYEGFEISYDGDSDEAIKSRVYALYEKNKELGDKFVAIEQDVEGIKQIVGSGGNIDGAIVDRVSKIEQTAEDIKLSVSNIEKIYSDDKELTQLREDLNSSIINLNADLGTLSSEISDYYKDNKISSEEKVAIETMLSEIVLSKSEVLKFVNKVILIADENGNTNNLNALNSAVSALENSHTNLVQNITVAISDYNITPSEKTVIIDAFAKYNLRINELKNLCDDIIFLGVGGIVSEQLAQINMKSNEIKLSINSVETNLSNTLSSQKTELESQISELQNEINDVINSIGDLETNMNEAFKDGVLSEAEKTTIRQQLQTLYKEKGDVDNQYQTIYSNPFLEDSSSAKPKSELKTAYDNFVSKYNSLITVIDTILEKTTIVDSSDRTKLETALSNYRTASSNYITKATNAIDAIASKKATEESEKINEKYAEILLSEDGIINRVGSVESTTSTLSNKVAEMVTNLDSITSRVSATETTSVTTQQQLDNLNTDLKTNYSTTYEMNSAIEQKANQITQSVSQSYVTKDEVDAIGVGGTNLLLHSSDYSDTSLWIRENAWATSSEYRGTCIYTTDQAWSYIGYSVNDLYDREVIELNTKYTFSCYVRSNNEAYQPDIHFYGHDNHSEQGAYVATVSTIWKRISVTFEWYDFSIRDYPISFGAITDTPQSGYYLEWSGFKLEKGMRATDWTPAPEDSAESENKWLFEKYASDLAVNSPTSVYPTFDDIKPGCLLSSELVPYVPYLESYDSACLGKITANFYFEADSTQTLTCTTCGNGSWYLNGQLVDTTYFYESKQITFYFRKGWNKLTVLYLEIGDGVYVEGLSDYTKMNAYNIGNIDEYGIYLNDKLISNYATKSEVTQTATDLTINFTESGGYNLIHNGHAYKDPQGNIPYWSNNGGSEFNIFEGALGGVRGNFFSLSMPSGIKYNDWIELKGNTHYVYQAQVCTGSPFTGNHNVPLHYWFSSNKSDIDKDDSVEFLDYNTTVSYAHTWTQIYIHFRTTEDVYMKPFIYGIDSSISPFYITEIMLSESRVVQRYAPNNEEIYDGITRIDKNGITVTQSNAKTKTTMSADGFAITRTDKNADIFKVGSNGLLTLNGVFKCYKDDANMSGARLEASGAIMNGYNSTGGSNPVFASGLWTDENMGYFSVGYTNALTTDANGCLWMSPQHGNVGCRLTYSKLVGTDIVSTNLYFQKDGALLFSTNINGLNSTDDRYTYQFDSGVSTRALRCDNLRTHNIYPRNTGSYDIGSASMRYKDIFGDSLCTTNSQLRLGTVTSAGAWQTYGALNINSRDGYVYPDKGTGQLSLGTSSVRFHTLYSVNAVSVSSDKRVKTDIHYLDEPVKETNIIDSEVPRVERNMNITTQDMYDFIKDDLKLASYRYNVNLERGNTSTDYGFIAQDILYTKVGSEIVQLEDKSDLNSNLSYNQGNYIATLAGALQEAIKKIEQLEDRIKELES